MPEMTFRVRWPDGTEVACYSPSLVIHDFLDEGADYPLQEFVDRSSAALDLASDRVRAKYGFVCTSALQQKSEIHEKAADFDGGDVRILRMAPPLPVDQAASPARSAGASA